MRQKAYSVQYELTVVTVCTERIITGYFCIVIYCPATVMMIADKNVDTIILNYYCTLTAIHLMSSNSDFFTCQATYTLPYL